MKRKFLFLLPLIFISAVSYAQYKIWETQLDVEYFTHLDRIYFLDENYGWAMGGCYFFTTNGGENWYLDPNWWPSNHWGSDIVFMNQDTGFIAGFNGTIPKTTDGGQNWTPVQTPATQNVFRLFFVDENNGWGALYNQVDDYQLIHTTDGGNNWVTQQVFSINTSSIDCLYFLNDSIGFAGGGYYDIPNDTIYSCIVKTVNNGYTWENIYISQNSFYGTHDIYFKDELTGWAVGEKSSLNSYLVLSTEDGGETWTEQTLTDNSYGTPTQANCMFFINDSIGWIGTSGPGFRGSIYITKDGGANWKLQQDFEQGIYDIQMLSLDTGWAVGGDFVYHTTNGSFVTKVIEHHVEKESLRIIPNPVTNTFRIETNIGFSCENCQLEITTITGNSILRLNSISFEATTSESIDLSNYPAGIYFVTIRYESNHQIKCFNQKIIKL
jgi:photosystem II stability/assembly factor-like uncharacterized protein